MGASKTIEIPETVFFSAESIDELEDWLASRDPQFVRDMRRIRAEEDQQGRGTDLTELLKRWPVG